MREREHHQELEARKSAVILAIRELRKKISSLKKSSGVQSSLHKSLEKADKQLEKIVKLIQKRTATIDVVEQYAAQINQFKKTLDTTDEPDQLKAIQDLLRVFSTDGEVENFGTKDIEADISNNTEPAEAPNVDTEVVKYEVNGEPLSIGDQITIPTKKRKDSGTTWTISRFEPVGAETKIYFVEEGGKKFSFLSTLQKDASVKKITSRDIDGPVVASPERESEPTLQVGTVLSYLPEGGGTERDLIRISRIVVEGGVEYAEYELQSGGVGEWLVVEPDLAEPLTSIHEQLRTGIYTLVESPKVAELQPITNVPDTVEHTAEKQRQDIQTGMYFIKERDGVPHVYKIQKIFSTREQPNTLLLEFDATPLADVHKKAAWKVLYQVIEKEEFEYALQHGEAQLTVKDDLTQRFQTVEALIEYTNTKNSKKPTSIDTEPVVSSQPERIDTVEQSNRPTPEQLAEKIKKMLDSRKDDPKLLAESIQIGRAFIQKKNPIRRPNNLRDWHDEDIQAVIHALEERLALVQVTRAQTNDTNIVVQDDTMHGAESTSTISEDINANNSETQTTVPQEPTAVASAVNSSTSTEAGVPPNLERTNRVEQSNRPTPEQLAEKIQTILHICNDNRKLLGQSIRRGKSFIREHNPIPRPNNLRDWHDEDIQAVVSALEERLASLRAVSAQLPRPEVPPAQDQSAQPVDVSIMGSLADTSFFDDSSFSAYFDGLPSDPTLPISEHPRNEVIRPTRSRIDFSPQEVREMIGVEAMRDALLAIARDDEEEFNTILQSIELPDSIIQKLESWGYTRESFLSEWNSTIVEELRRTLTEWIGYDMRDQIGKEEYGVVEQLTDKIQVGFWEQAKYQLAKNIPALAIGGVVALALSTVAAPVVTVAASTGVIGMVKKFFTRKDIGSGEQDKRNRIIERKSERAQSHRNRLNQETIQTQLEQRIRSISPEAIFGLLAQGIRDKGMYTDVHENIFDRKAALLARAATESHSEQEQFALQLDSVLAECHANNERAKQTFLAELGKNSQVDALVQKILGEINYTRVSSKSALEEETTVDMLRQYAVSALIGASVGVAFATDDSITRQALSGSLGAGYGYLYGAKLDKEKQTIAFIEQITKKIEQFERGEVRPEQRQQYEQDIRGVLRMGLFDRKIDLRLRAQAVLRELDREEEQTVISNESLDAILEKINQKQAATHTRQTELAKQLLEKRAGGWRKWAGLIGGGAVGIVSGRIIGYLKDSLGFSGSTSTEPARESVAPAVSEPAAPSSTEPASASDRDVSPDSRRSSATPETNTRTAEESVVGPGSGLRAEVERGQGAYHAVYDLMDQLSPEDTRVLAESIAERHPEWVERDAAGQIINTDRILRNWRVEAVNTTRLDSGNIVSVYNAATREYGVRLHAGAEFSLEYDADGYPILQLHGTEDSGNFEVLDEPIVRMSTSRGSTVLVEADEVPRATNDTTTDIGSTPDRDFAMDTPQAPRVVSDGTAAAQDRSLVGNIGTGNEVTGSALVTSDTLPMRAAQVYTRVVGEPLENRSPQLDTRADLGVPEPRRIELGNDRFIEFTYTEDGTVNPMFRGNMSRISYQMRVTPMLERDALFATNDGDLLTGAQRREMELRLNHMYVYDEALQVMRSNGQQDTPEYTMLRNMYRNNMNFVARLKGASVQEVFQTDVLRQHGFRVEEELNTGDNPDTVGFSEELMTRIRAASGDFSTVQRNEVRVYVQDLQRFGVALDGAENASAEEAIRAQIRQVQSRIVTLLEQVEAGRS